MATVARTVYIGWDRREDEAYQICRASIQRRLTTNIPIHKLALKPLIERGLYYRPMTQRNGRLYDHRSATADYDGAMATEFAISRFLTPALAKEGLALFLDCDMLCRCDLTEVFELCKPEHAVTCVQHDYAPKQTVKMDNQLQTFYRRKNWTSFIVFNCDHPANRNHLRTSVINEKPGRWLHALSWLLNDDLIGALPATYNHLVGEQPHDPDAKVVHFTNGGPWFKQYVDVPFAAEWFSEAQESADRRLKSA